MLGFPSWKPVSRRRRLNATPNLVFSSAYRCSATFPISEGEKPEAAQRAVKCIREGLTIRSYQPEIGRPTEDMEPEYREWLVNFGDSGYISARCLNH